MSPASPRAPSASGSGKKLTWSVITAALLPKHHASKSHRPRLGSERASNAVAGPSRVANHQLAGQSLHVLTEYDNQDRHGRAQKERSARTIGLRFKCQICLEEHVENSVARIDSCGHSFCRECIAHYVGYKLDENRFPILCPACVADHRKNKPGGM
jgi:hypothetical protein